MVKWIDELFSVNKTAEQTDAATEFTKKAKKSAWVESVMGINEDGLKKEADLKIEAELAVRDEITKEAAYDAFETTEETLKRDYARDASILSDFTLASMIAEVRGHAKQDFPENATKYFEDAKKDIKADRKAVEKELLAASGMSAQLDWRKSFADYKKDETPKQATEKELYNAKLEEVNDDLSKGAKVDEYSLTDEQHAKTTLGLGREQDQRTDVTAQPGETKNESLGKISEKTAALVRDPDVELKVGSIIRLARSIMSHEGQILNEGTSWEIAGIDGFHYTLSANGQKHVISSHDTPKFNKLASQTEIENHATKEQIITKLAEINSPWAVVIKDGQEVVARVVDEQVSKESEEGKKDLNK